MLKQPLAITSLLVLMLVFLYTPNASATMWQGSFSTTLSTSNLPAGWNYGDSYQLSLTYNDSTSLLSLLNFSIGSVQFIDPSNNISQICVNQCTFFSSITTSKAALSPFELHVSLSPRMVGFNALNTSELSYFGSTTTTGVSMYKYYAGTFSAEQPSKPVPAPPAWLIMLTGLGILIPLYRRHVEAHRKGVDEDQGVAV